MHKRGQNRPKTGPKEGLFRGTTNHPKEGKTPVLRVLAAYILHTTTTHHAIIVLLHVRIYVHIIVLLHVPTYTCTMYLHTYIAYGMYMIPCIAHVAYTHKNMPKEGVFLVCSGTTNNTPSCTLRWYPVSSSSTLLHVVLHTIHTYVPYSM